MSSSLGALLYCTIALHSLSHCSLCRDNLDPFSQHQDAELWEALGDCHVAGAVRSLGGLGAVVGEVGGGLSAGQLQLLCLARVLLRKPKVRQRKPCTYSTEETVFEEVQQFIHVLS